MGKGTEKGEGMRKKKLRKPETRRRVGLFINQFVFAHFCKNGVIRIEDSPIPDDAEFVGVYFDALRDGWIIAFDHKSFDELSEGCCIPIINDRLKISHLYEAERLLKEHEIRQVE